MLRVRAPFQGFRCRKLGFRATGTLSQKNVVVAVLSHWVNFNVYPKAQNSPNIVGSLGPKALKYESLEPYLKDQKTLKRCMNLKPFSGSFRL